MTAPSSYTDSLSAMAYALATGAPELVSTANTRQQALARLFVETNWIKRAGKIMAHLWLVNDHVDGLHTMVEDFVKTTPQRAYATVSDDAAAFLDTIDAVPDMSAEQHDAIRCQRGYSRVSRRARMHTEDYHRFQEIHSVRDVLVGDLDKTDVMVHANPTTTWVALHSEVFLDGPVPLPCTVAMFAIDGEIRTAHLGEQASRMWWDLVSHAPISILSWSALSPEWHWDDLREFVVTMSNSGLVAMA